MGIISPDRQAGRHVFQSQVQLKKYIGRDRYLVAADDMLRLPGRVGQSEKERCAEGSKYV